MSGVRLLLVGFVSGVEDRHSLSLHQRTVSPIRFKYLDRSLHAGGGGDQRSTAMVSLCRTGLVALVLWEPTPAGAHIVRGEAVGFVSGFAHPVSGLDHVAAMIAVGLWGAQLGAPAIWLLPVTFPLVMAFGGFLGLIGLHLPGSEIAIALSGVALGGAVVGEVRPPLWAAAALVGVFGLFHGYAHGAELPPGQNALLYSLGFVLATGLLHAAGVLLGLVHRWSWGRWAVRGAGLVICVCGAVFLWTAVA